MSDEWTRRLLELRAEAERTRAEASRAEGALSHLLGQLESEFGRRSVTEGEELLAELQDEVTDALAASEREYEAYLKSREAPRGEVREDV